MEGFIAFSKLSVSYSMILFSFEDYACFTWIVAAHGLMVAPGFGTLYLMSRVNLCSSGEIPSSHSR